MKSREKLEKEVMDWSGLQLEGETKEELRESLKSIQWTMENDVEVYSERFRDKINKLRIKERK